VKRQKIADTFELARDVRSRVTLAAVDPAIGSTTIAQAASLWLALYGHSIYTLIVAKSPEAAVDYPEHAMLELSNNDLLLEDFPEAVYPIRCLEGKRQRVASQLCGGQETCMSWSTHRVRLPVITGAPSSGCLIESISVTGAFCGLTRDAGPLLDCHRPAFVIADNPFSQASLESPAQFATRREVLSRVIPSLGGPGIKIPVVMLLGPEAIAGIARGETVLPAKKPNGDAA
jgi:hypothetical protein